MATPLISISIVSHGQRDFVRRLLRSFLAVSNDDCSIEIVLTENLRSHVLDMGPFGELKTTCLINPHPQGLADNQNQAFRHACGEYFCILNPDVTLIRPVFAPLLEHITQDRADIVAPLVKDEQGTALDSFRDLPTPLELIRRRLTRQRTLSNAEHLPQFVHPDWIAGTFLLMRRRTFEELGGLDDRYFLYFEDVDFCSRARLAGKRLLVDTSVEIVHVPRRASQRNLRHLRWHLRSAWRFFTSDIYRQVRSLDARIDNA